MSERQSFLRRLLGSVSGSPGEPPLPPEEFRPGVGAGEFSAIGREFLGLFQRYGGLRPDERVLDVGCGVGRMAAPLLAYIDRGSYDGFDQVILGIGNPAGRRWRNE